MNTFEKHSVEDVQKIIADKREALRMFRFGGAGSRTRDVRSGRNLRKEIAQALTELRARELVPVKALLKQVVQVQKDLKKLVGKAPWNKKLAGSKKSA